MNDVAETGLVEQGRNAASTGAWPRAYDLLARADQHTRLSIDELGLLAEVAYAAGHLDVTIEAWERAHAEAARVGDSLAAADAATRVALHLLMDTALMAPIRGWVNERSGCSRGPRRVLPMPGWRSSRATTT
jgi:multidrug resistance efflux pump